MLFNHVHILLMEKKLMLNMHQLKVMKDINNNLRLQLMLLMPLLRQKNVIEKYHQKNKKKKKKPKILFLLWIFDKCKKYFIIFFWFKFKIFFSIWRNFRFKHWKI